jgi:putative ABC transport system permease protein
MSAWGFGGMLSILSQAWRSWKTSKTVALLAAAALAVGIGSTTAIYTVVNSVMLKPLPYQHAERYTALFGGTVTRPEGRAASTYPDLLKYQQRTQSFDVFGWFQLNNYNLTSPGQPQHISGVAVTVSLADNLGVSPILGQWFTDDAGAVLSSALWQRLGADPDIVGKPITLNDRTYTVTGVMPPRFRLPASGAGPGVEGFRSDVWIALDPVRPEQGTLAAYYFCYARLKPGVSRAQAEADVKRVAAQIVREDPASHPAYTAYLDDLQEIGIQEIRPTLLWLFGAAGLLLLITCANVAGLLLARSVARARETAIRVALGASRRQLALHYFLEGLILSLAAAAAGVLLSLALVRVVVTLAADYIPRADEIALDWKVAVFAVVTACLATALFSLAPLWQAVRTSPKEVLADGARTSAGARSRKLSRSLVVAEIALAFALLAVGAALAAHLRNLSRTSPGFDPDNLLAFRITVAESSAANTDARVSLQVRLTQALQQIPGVSDVGLNNQLPLDGCCYSTTVYPEGRQTPPEANERTAFLAVTPGYFGAMRIPLRSGRFLENNDASEELLHVVINEAAARIYWPNQNPLDAYGRVGGPDGSRFQVVGVVGDVRNDGLNAPTVPEIYLMSFIVPVNPMRWVVRSTRPSAALIPEVRRAVQGVDATLPIHDVKVMNEIVRDSVTLERTGTLMTTLFASAALLMATLGIYGVVSYSVRQRTVEIGTRMAIGAGRGDVLSLMLGGGMKMAFYGIVLGAAVLAAAGLPLSRALKVGNLEYLPLAYSSFIVAGVSLAACFFPAWRASLLSPMVAIRDDPHSMWQSARQSIRHAVGQISDVVSRPGDAAALTQGALLAEFTDAARRAKSPAEALQTALARLRERIGAQSAVLLENVPGHYRRVAAAPSTSFSDFVLPAPGFLLNRLRFHSFALPLQDSDFDAWLRWAGENRPQHIAEIQTLKDAAARIAVPLRTRTGILGVLLLGAPVDRPEYSSPEKRALRSCADQFALMLENARLTGRVLEQEKLRRDLELAAEVQKRLLPAQAPPAGVAALSAVSLPARSVGGDYYDFLDVGEQRIGIALADIAGKGIAAALIMSVVQASLRVIASEGDITLPLLAAKMNSFLHRSTGSNSYATFFYAQIDEKNRRLHYVNAGHNPPYLLRRIDPRSTNAPDVSEAEIEELSTGGTVLGLFPQASYEEATIELHPGDVLVVFTDGVTEALNPNEEEFGEDRLKQLLRQVIHLPVNEITSRISEGLKNWIQEAEQYDDLTFLVMKVQE